jgi:RNA binding exosome subunit
MERFDAQLVEYFSIFAGESISEDEERISKALKDKMGLNIFVDRFKADGFTGENFLIIVLEVAKELGENIEAVIEVFCRERPAFEDRITEAYHQYLKSEQ